jgi:hypothetical protein
MYHWIFIIAVTVFCATVFRELMLMINEGSHDEKQIGVEKPGKLQKAEKIKLLPFPKYSKSANDINIILQNINILKPKTGDLMKKITVLSDNNKLLEDVVDADKTAESIYKKNEYAAEYLSKFYDKYVSLFLELSFSGFIFYVNKEDIKTLNIKNEIELLQKGIKEQIYYFFPKNKTIDQIISDSPATGSALKRIFEDINKLKIQLIAAQSSQILSSISPLENENELNILKYFYDYKNIIIDVDSLNKEYDRFISEHETTNEGLYLFNNRAY